jgi:type I restriction enzyme, S subunit
MAEQRRLIALLREKRQAVISRAVTKGLDPAVPMKSSGVEWIGDIPSHWSLVAFGRCIDIAEGQVDPKDGRFASLPLIAPNHVETCTGRLLLIETAEEQGAESGKYQCREGDVIYSKIRPALRKATIAPGECLCSADMYPLRVRSGLVNSYLLWLILSDQFSAFAVLESQRVAMPKINRESLRSVMLPVPPQREQVAIASYIERSSQQIDALVEEAYRAVSLLQERRTALISAAVTGQIDVRVRDFSVAALT